MSTPGKCGKHAREVRSKDADPSPDADNPASALIDRRRRAIDAMRRLRRASRPRPTRAAE